MAGYPTDVRYTENHEWVRAADNVLTVGITQFAADRLGAIGFVELPYAGELFKPGALIARLRGDDASAVLRMPLVGQIKEVNQPIGEMPGPINSDPYGAGWIVRVEPGDITEVDNLMDAAQYEAFLSASDD